MKRNKKVFWHKISGFILKIETKLKKVLGFFMMLKLTGDGISERYGVNQYI